MFLSIEPHQSYVLFTSNSFNKFMKRNFFPYFSSNKWSWITIFPCVPFTTKNRWFNKKLGFHLKRKIRLNAFHLVIVFDWNVENHSSSGKCSQMTHWAANIRCWVDNNFFEKSWIAENMKNLMQRHIQQIVSMCLC